MFVPFGVHKLSGQVGNLTYFFRKQGMVYIEKRDLSTNASPSLYDGTRGLCVHLLTTRRL